MKGAPPLRAGFFSPAQVFARGRGMRFPCREGWGDAGCAHTNRRTSRIQKQTSIESSWMPSEEMVPMTLGESDEPRASDIQPRPTKTRVSLLGS